MIIAAYAALTTRQRPEELLRGLEKALAISCGGETPSIVALPEHARLPLEKVERMSRRYPTTLILPGTTPVTSDQLKPILGENCPPNLYFSVFNIATAYYGGKQLFACGKRSFVEREGYGELDFYQLPEGTTIGRWPDEKSNLFTWEKTKNGLEERVTIGVEICADHSIGTRSPRTRNAVPVLKSQLSRTNHDYHPPRQPDLQLVLSHGLMGLNPQAVVVREGGACLLIDGSEPPSAIACLRKEDGRLHQLSPITKIRGWGFKTDTLFLYHFNPPTESTPSTTTQSSQSPPPSTLHSSNTTRT